MQTQEFRSSWFYCTIKRAWIPLSVLFFVCLFGISLWAADAGFAKAASVSARLPIYAVECEEKTLALTINCAWGDEDMASILQILQEEEIPATFFFVGSFVDAHPQWVRAVFDAGHEVANHSDTHKDFAHASAAEIEQEVERCSDKLEHLIGKRPALVRCPSGSYNNQAIDTIRALGYEAIQWSVDSIDWQNPSAEEMEARILPKLQNGDILLFHSGTKNTAAALPQLIRRMKEEGYSFVTVSELLIPNATEIDAAGRQKRLKNA